MHERERERERERRGVKLKRENFFSVPPDCYEYLRVLTADKAVFPYNNVLHLMDELSARIERSWSFWSLSIKEIASTKAVFSIRWQAYSITAKVILRKIIILSAALVADPGIHNQ